MLIMLLNIDIEPPNCQTTLVGWNEPCSRKPNILIQLDWKKRMDL